MTAKRAPLALVVLLTMARAPVAFAGAADPDSEDLRAKDLFQAQRYADALAIYTKLYAETRHPTYLRNLGRCHQMMRQPEPAIARFRAYLSSARDLGPGERTEIEGYIADMQALEAAQSAAPPPPAIVLEQQPRGPSDADARAGAGTQPPSPNGPSITHRWWFWTGLGVLLVGGVVASIVAASGSSGRLPCPPETVCPP